MCGSEKKLWVTQMFRSVCSDLLQENVRAHFSVPTQLKRDFNIVLTTYTYCVCASSLSKFRTQVHVRKVIAHLGFTQGDWNAILYIFKVITTLKTP